MSEELTNSAFWDYVSVMASEADNEGRESFKDLINEAYDFFKQFLGELYYIEANFIYLNLVMNVPQQTIANMYGISQLGVSKRVRAGIKKIRNLLNKPEKDMEIVSNDMRDMLPPNMVVNAILYYKFGSYSLVANFTNQSVSNVQKNIKAVVDRLESIASDAENTMSETAERYVTYIKMMQKVHNYGDYLFKGDIGRDEDTNVD